MWILFLSAALATPTEILLQEGMTAQRAGDVALALQRYQACLEADPTHVGCHWEIGWSYWTEGRWSEVVKHWNRVKELDPSHTQVYKHLPAAEEHLRSLSALEALARSAPETVRPPIPAGRTLRIRAVGDIMLGTDFPGDGEHLAPDDGAHLLDEVKALTMDADVTFGNLEGPLCDTGTTRKCSSGGNCYAFRSPTRYGAYMKAAGIDMMSTANNHAGDFGEECRLATERTLADLGIAYSGRPGTVATVEVDGLKVGMIGFHTSRNSHYVNDHEMAAKLVRAVDAGHDLVIVSFHGGAEGSKATHVPDEMELFYGEERGHLRVFARTVIDAGADLVLGHGPHVPRGLQVIDGHLVAYSLGNFATYGRFNLSGHLGTSLVLEVILDHEGKLVSGKILPVKQIGDGIPQPDPANTAIDLIRSLSEEDFGDSAPLVGQDGTFAAR
ncbi:MAG TPA: CapA family protein [Deltaproteobacteria bacterium]|nr:CapA family protein [Deltaproteobacteria bacterium]